MEQKDFGQYIKQLREENGYTSQRAFAQKLGVSNATIARIERGEVSPTPETLHKIAEALNVDYIDLIEKQAVISEGKNDTLFSKINRLNKNQVSVLNDMVDEFLKLGGKA